MMTAPIITKTQRAGPASLRLIDLANAGEATRVINPAIKATFNPLTLFSIVVSSSL
jgi:hypothetical protein